MTQSTGYSPASASQKARDNENKRRSTSWLITYADLMTILVCFFVLIVSFSIQDQVKLEVVAGSMRNAFGVAEERRYAGDFKLDGTPEQLQPGNIRPTPTPSANGITQTLTARPAAGSNGTDGAYERAISEDAIFENITQKLEKAILTHPLLKDKSEAITISLTPEGLQIIAVDLNGAPMFESGRATPTPHARALLSQITNVLIPLPNRITVTGHADANRQGLNSPFELTANRANAARKIIEEAGLRENRIAGVIGHGHAMPLYPDDPYAAGNRRIEIVLERAAPLLPPERSL